jgi:hypothetical protein
LPGFDLPTCYRPLHLVRLEASRQHSATVRQERARIADAAGLIRNPELAAARMLRVLGLDQQDFTAHGARLDRANPKTER